MRFFRDDVLMRRAAGLSLLFSLLWLLAWQWRERISGQSSYETDTLNAAQRLTETFGALAFVCALFVAVSLIFTSRTKSID